MDVPASGQYRQHVKKNHADKKSSGDFSKSINVVVLPQIFHKNAGEAV
ncbi:hypothetical protein V461_13295 [Pantoea ananatis BRT98]|jgi:hypothetical protein|nr:hypothetical protein V461_13295 [Pantoea ananatis BRT98]